MIVAAAGCRRGVNVVSVTIVVDLRGRALVAGACARAAARAAAAAARGAAAAAAGARAAGADHAVGGLVKHGGCGAIAVDDDPGAHAVLAGL